MNRAYVRVALALGLVAIALSGAAQQRPTEGAFDLSWHTFDGGGGMSSGGDFELAGTIGQHDAGGPLTGGGFELVGGFWAAGADPINLCPADINDDDVVNVVDLLAVINNWNAGPGNPADVNNDGTVNVLDLLAVITAWGACP